jgi:hypothetical protein
MTGVPVPCHSAMSGARCTALAEVLVVTRFMRVRSVWNGADIVIGSEPIKPCAIIKRVARELEAARTEDSARGLLGAGNLAGGREEGHLVVQIDELLAVVHCLQHDVPVGLAFAVGRAGSAPCSSWRWWWRVRL